MSNFFAIAAVTDSALSLLTGVTSGTTHTYTFQAVDINGATKTVGGDIVTLIVSPIGTVPGLPLSVQMTDHGNGLHTGSFIASLDTFYVNADFNAQGI